MRNKPRGVPSKSDLMAQCRGRARRRGRQVEPGQDARDLDHTLRIVEAARGGSSDRRTAKIAPTRWTARSRRSLLCGVSEGNRTPDLQDHNLAL